MRRGNDDSVDRAVVVERRPVIIIEGRRVDLDLVMKGMAYM